MDARDFFLLFSRSKFTCQFIYSGGRCCSTIIEVVANAAVAFLVVANAAVAF